MEVKKKGLVGNAVDAWHKVPGLAKGLICAAFGAGVAFATVYILGDSGCDCNDVIDVACTVSDVSDVAQTVEETIESDI